MTVDENVVNISPVEGTLPKKKKKLTAKRFFKHIWKKEKLMIFILVGVIIGFLVGCLANAPIRKLNEPVKTDAQIGAEFLGQIFLRCLRLVILPLVISSLIRGMSSLGGQSAGRIGVSTLVYYFVTTLLAVILGIILVVTIAPGKRANYNPATDETVPDSRPLDLFLDIIRNLFPDNIVQACFNTFKTNSKQVTEYENVQEIVIPSEFETWDDETKEEFINSNNVINVTKNDDGTYTAFNGTSRTYATTDGSSYSNAINMLGIITFSIVFGVYLGRLKEKGKAFIEILEAIELVSIKMINLIMLFSPVGICSLIIGQFWKIDDIPSVFASLALYLVTVILALAIHLFFTILIIYYGVTKKNPLVYMKNMLKAILTAFATASSSATIPVTLQCLDDKNQVDPRISRFMIPIGATVNMDGTALYEAVAAIFIAQVYNGNLSAGNIIVTSLTATMASVGAAGVPQGGLVTLVIVLQVLGLPADSLGLILSVDWLLDRFRTVVNVLGDAFGCAVVESYNKKLLQKSSGDLFASENDNLPSYSEPESELTVIDKRDEYADEVL